MKKKYNFFYLIWLTFVSAMGGLLFGYDWVVIGGAKPFYEVFFDIAGIPSLQGWAMSSALVGCVAGAMIAGGLADRYGRKWLLIIAAFLFVVSAYGTGAVDSFNYFIFYRILGGISIGLASTLSPLYIAEVAPAEYRGRLVAINQLTVVIGILAAQVVNLWIAEPVIAGDSGLQILQSWNGQHGWRWMFWATIAPAMVFLILMFLIPESPRFLAKRHKDQQALDVLARIGGAEYARQELANIQATFSPGLEDKSTVRDLFDVKVFPILKLGILLAVFQQWCGINIIFNYAQEIFAAAGYSVNDMFLNIVITGSVNLVFTFVAIRLVDRWGRRFLMLFGAGGLALIYGLMGSIYYFNITGLPVLVMVVIAIAVYAMSLAPITWVVLSEIFPNRVRGAAMSVATLSLWVSSFILTFTFPILNSSLGAAGTFWVYGAICLLGFIYIKAKLPETKNQSLEEIEENFYTNQSAHELSKSLEREDYHSNVRGR